MENRIFDFDVLPEIKNHWSPRAFDVSHFVPKEEIMALLEAARYAPSCFNEQPWRFVVAQTKEERKKLAGVLSPSNQIWASKAPVLILILSKQNFANNNKNRWHQFDAGTAWGYLSLEAQRRGLITHAMAGFSPELARKAYSIPEDYSIIAVVAVGYYGSINDLSPDLQAKEKPAPRHSIEEILFHSKEVE